MKNFKVYAHCVRYYLKFGEVADEEGETSWQYTVFVPGDPASPSVTYRCRLCDECHVSTWPVHFGVDTPAADQPAPRISQSRAAEAG
jgi:hypothetical protein